MSSKTKIGYADIKLDAAEDPEEKSASEQPSDEKIGGLTTRDIQKKGKKFLVPDGMELHDAVLLLERKIDEEEGRIEVVECINAFPWDGARAFEAALKEKFGVTYKEKMVVNTMFGDEERLPEQVSVEVDFEKTETVYWGQCSLPGIEGFVKTEVNHKDGFLVFQIRANVLQKHEQDVREIAELTRKHVKLNSIYRGKAFSIKFLDERGRKIRMPEPKFINLSAHDPNGLIYTRPVEMSIALNLWTPLRRTEECRQHKIPLKRGILLYGQYGTGKTLTAYHTAKIAKENGWTFIYIHHGDELPDAIKMAQQYEPAVIFCEDIDSVMRGERTMSINSVLNSIDGIENKSSELITVLTSNHVGDICKAMLRPGRIDAAIEVTTPDVEAVGRLIRHYAGSSLAEDIDLTAASEELEGEIPAMIGETVEKAKLAALSNSPPGAPLKITGESLIQAALTMRSQRILLRAEQDPDYSYEEKAALLAVNTLIAGVMQIIKDWRGGK